MEFLSKFLSEFLLEFSLDVLMEFLTEFRWKHQYGLRILEEFRMANPDGLAFFRNSSKNSTVLCSSGKIPTKETKESVVFAVFYNFLTVEQMAQEFFKSWLNLQKSAKINF